MDLRAKLKSPHRVYALRSVSGRIVYVGRTSNLARRIAEHRRRKLIPFVDYVVWKCFEFEKSKHEAWLINRHRPRFNKFVPFHLAERTGP